MFCSIKVLNSFLNLSIENLLALSLQFSGINFEIFFSKISTLSARLLEFCFLKKTPVGFKESIPFIVSNAPPFPKAITGVPQLCASIGAIPKSS